MAVINSHFAAHQNKIKERNQDYSRIVTTMSARLSEEVDELSRRAMKKKKGQKKSTARQAAYGSGDERMEQYLESQRDLESRLEGDSRGIPRQPLIEAKVAARFDTDSMWKKLQTQHSTVYSMPSSLVTSITD